MFFLAIEFCKSMAPGGHIFKQTTLTGKTIRATQSPDESNNVTPPVNTDDSTKIRNGRGKTRGKGLERMRKTMGSKMKIEIPLGKGRPTKPTQSAKLSNELGIIARNFLSLPNKWKELTREDKDAALIRCHEKFEIDLDEHYVKDSVEDILKNRSRQWRYKLKQLFESARSEEEARKIEVPELTRENWNKLCDMWADPEHKAENGVEPDRIEFYKSTHYSTEKGWSSLEAETNYNNLKDLKDIYTSGEPGEPSMTIDQIMDTILGKKSGYIKGLGYGPKPDTTRATQRRTAELEDSLRKTKEEAATAQHDLQKRLNAAEIVVETQQSKIETQQSQIETQQDQIQALNSQLVTLAARQEEMFKKMQHFVSSSPSRY
ncbi:uncharacterized protein LOC132059130 isoform X3 [Lycium ferocissimum]|uniref:uncharacterized protein LOC132059130 isoform X3 n=1 Tax=Lycium ferocissimum TaxID=112874 RepID=UPI0028152841|nr:uncharacterized protein LOC132059130 isoform X3 [Lycium ferocissimum]